MNKKGKLHIWPNYFDLNKTRKNGRRVPKHLALALPKILDIKEAVTKLGLNYEIFTEACYPKKPYAQSGLILIQTDQKKNFLLKQISKILVKNK